MIPSAKPTTATTDATKPTNKPSRLCAHIKTNGEKCEALSLSDDTFCYYHARDRQRTLVIERAHLDRIARLNVGMPAAICHRQNTLNKDVFDETAAHLMHCLELPLLEDANAISVTATNIMRALATQHLDRRHAGTKFYGLQIVSSILKHLKPEPRSYRSKATADPEPLQELKAMLATLREKKKAAASSNQSGHGFTRAEEGADVTKGGAGLQPCVDGLNNDRALAPEVSPREGHEFTRAVK